VGSYESGNDFNEHGFLYHGSTYTTIDVPSDGINTVYGTYANGINNAGDIVGYYYDDNYSVDSGQHGFFYDGTHYVTLDDPDALYGTQAVAINDTGQIAGNYYDASKQLGFVYDENTHNYTTIDDPNGLYGTRVLAINDAGEVLGTYYDTTGQHAFLYDASGYTTLDHPGAVFGTTAGGINDLGHVTGSYSPNSNFGFLAILS